MLKLRQFHRRAYVVAEWIAVVAPWLTVALVVLSGIANASNGVSRQDMFIFIFALPAAGLSAAVIVRLRARLGLFQEAIEATDSAIAVYDSKDRLLLANSRYRRTIGAPEGTVAPGVHYKEIARAGLDVSWPEEKIEAELERRLAIQRAADGTPSDRRYNGDAWFRVTKTRTPRGLNVGIGIDVTDTYALRAKVSAEAERFRALATSAPVGICQIAPDGTVEFVNDRLVQLLNLDPDTPPDNALANLRASFKVGDHVLPSFHALTRYLRQGPVENEVELLADAARHFLVRAASVQGSAEENWPGANPAPSPCKAHPLGEGLTRILSFVDITDRKRAEAEINYLAMHDGLTGAWNRLAFNRDLPEMARAATAARPLSLLAIDIDGFKPVNDEHGHAVGDDLLREIVARVTNELDQDTRLYRLGGDEFSVMRLVDSTCSSAELAERLLERLCAPFAIAGKELFVGASIGFSALPTHTDDTEALMHYADLALYDAKRAGGSRVRFFDPADLKDVCAA